MNEKLLQYIWNYKIFSHFNFQDTTGKPIEVLNSGDWNHNAGPDFLMAKIKHNNLIHAGNIELHVRSSDWIFHQHTEDPAFSNIILHVVYHDDTEVEVLKKRNVPTLELKNYIYAPTLNKYETLLHENQFISCEKLLTKDHLPLYFYEENLLKKLDEKSLEIEQALEKHKNNYESVLFHQLAFAFGLKINAEIFKELAESLDFGIILKTRQNQDQLEALLLGRAGLLANPQDEQSLTWAKEYQYLKTKFKLTELYYRPKFMRLRPPNFPTIRLSQLVHLYHQNNNLFSKIIEAKTIDALYVLFEKTKASTYWNTHYNLGKTSEKDYEKDLTKDFVQLIIINSILPIKYTYAKNHNENITDEILNYYEQIPPENNSIISSWEKLGIKVENALQSQALLYQHKTLCREKKCLNCSIGLRLLKNENETNIKTIEA